MPRIALTLDDAAFSLGMSRDTFDRYVKPQVRLVRYGRLVTVAVVELERYVERHGSRISDDLA